MLPLIHGTTVNAGLKPAPHGRAKQRGNKDAYMQIEEGLVVKFFAWVFGGITTLLATLYWYIWKGDRRRLKALEEQMSKAVTKHEVEIIVGKVQDRFREEHKGLFEKIESVHEEIRINKQEIREDIRDLRDTLTTKYAGADRRRT